MATVKRNKKTKKFVKSARPIIFTCSEILEACNTALSKSEPLSTVFDIKFDKYTPKANTPQYFGLFARVGDKYGRLQVTIKFEKHVGQIAPLLDADLGAINTRRAESYGFLKKRDRHPTINIQKYVESDTSDFFAVCEFVNKFFDETIQSYVDNGDLTQDKKSTKMSVPNVRIVPLIQTYSSSESKTSPGIKLENPICRVTMKFDPISKLPLRDLEFYNYDTMKILDNKEKKFEPLMFDGKNVDANNVHQIRTHSQISGVVNMDAVCASVMGISIPMTMKIVFVKAPVIQKILTSDVFGPSDSDSDSDDEEDEEQEIDMGGVLEEFGL